MSAELPLARPEPAMTEVVVGAPVRGRLGRELAHMLHWCRGHGMNVIPLHRPGIQVAGSAQTLRYRVEPQGHAISRLWVIYASQPEAFTGGTTPCTLSVTLPNGTAYTIAPDVVIGLGGLEPRFLLREDLTAKSDAEQELAITFTRTAGTATATILAVGCWELPRTQLTLDSYDRGVDIETCQAGQPLYDSINASLGALAEHWPRTWPRRSLVQWSGPWLEVNSGSYVDLLELAEPVFPHKALRDDTTLSCKWTVYYKTDAGTAGDIRITTGIDGNTDTITLAEETSGAWATASTINIRCDDPTTADGTPGAWETVQWAVRRTSGAGVIYVSARALWEPVTVSSYLMTEDGFYLLQEDGSRIVLE